MNALKIVYRATTKDAAEMALDKAAFRWHVEHLKKWSVSINNWNPTLSQLAIYFERRLNKILDI
jgi:transposase-like protein